MENKEMDDERYWKQFEKSHRRGKVAGGLLLFTIGSLFMARELGVELPTWLFTWKMLLIGIGLTFAIKHAFRRMGWLIPVGVGVAFIMADNYPTMSVKPFIWPAVLILIGLIVIFKPRHRKPYHHWRRYRKHHRDQWKQWENCDRPGMRHFPAEEHSEDFLESTAVFGAIKKNVITKTFKGGEITTVFGGTEVDLSQADFEDTISIEITQVFGGARLIMPANWEIKPTVVTVMGNIEDKRPTHAPVAGAAKKVVKLTGTCVCGGIEITSFA